jgi:hypothetical protein
MFEFSGICAIFSIKNHQSSINPSSTSTMAHRRARFPENLRHPVNT